MIEYEFGELERHHDRIETRQAVCTCYRCEEILYRGTRAYKLDGVILCADCVEGMALEELKDFVEYTPTVKELLEEFYRIDPEEL